jgi:hypothetical protein
LQTGGSHLQTGAVRKRGVTFQPESNKKREERGKGEKKKKEERRRKKK